MPLTIRLRDDQPAYLQIVEQVRRQVAFGQLRPGEELKPLRVLAAELLVHPNTVARAYDELETEGLVVKESTKGTFVSKDPNSPLVRQCRLQRLTRALESYLDEAEQLHLSANEVIQLLSERYKARGPRNQES